jgi:hypothetical protein
VGVDGSHTGTEHASRTTNWQTQQTQQIEKFDKVGWGWLVLVGLVGLNLGWVGVEVGLIWVGWLVVVFNGGLSVSRIIL